MITSLVSSHSNWKIRTSLLDTDLAFSQFRAAFVGFRPPMQLASIISAVPEFKSMFSSTTLSSFNSIASSSSSSDSSIKSSLRSLFSEAINLSSSQVKPLITSINDRLEKEGAEGVFGSANDFNAKGDANATGESEAEAMARVWKISFKTYGDEDVGILVSTCMMNLLRMRKGEGAWILGEFTLLFLNEGTLKLSRIRLNSRRPSCVCRRRYHRSDGVSSQKLPRIRLEFRNRAHSFSFLSRHRNSDNMVAHGLGTEEQGGISTFVDMLSYRHLPASKLLLSYEDSSKYGKNGCTRYYDVRTDSLVLNLRLS